MKYHPCNIMSDDDLNAYLCDFGLARLIETSITHATTGVFGTLGYVAPEYAMTCYSRSTTPKGPPLNQVL